MKLKHNISRLQIANSERCSLLPASRIPHPHRGMTLVELLVVIVILTTVVAAAIPIMAPSNVDRQLREATRSLNTFITGAQARAIASGRPYGILLKRLSQETNTNPNKNFNPALDIHDDNGVCLEVFYVEEQPPFTGFSRDSRVCIARHPTQLGLLLICFVTRGNVYQQNQDRLPVGWDPDLLPPDTISYDDVIEIGDSRFRFSGQEQTQTRGGKVGYLPGQNGSFVIQFTITPINDTGQQFVPEHDRDGYQLGNDRPPPPAAPATARPPFWSAPMTYRILRRPTTTSDEPFQLPEGTAIDLRASGVGSQTFFHNPEPTNADLSVNNSEPVIIMFAPEGRISRVMFSELPNRTSSTFPAPGESVKYDESVVDNVYLLVARRENVPPTALNNDPTLNSSQFSVATNDQQRQEMKEPINWLSGTSRWVVLGAQTGRIVTIENSFVDPSQLITLFGTSDRDALRNQQILAAREFAPEMSQLGGR